MVFICYYCKETSPSPSLLIKHLKYFCKSTGKNSYFHCGEHGCSRNYLSVNSFKKYIIRDHIHQYDRQNIDEVTLIDIPESPSSTAEVASVEIIRPENKTPCIEFYSFHI